MNNSGVSSELQQGKAAEHLVCADIILQGFSAFLADQGLPYDVIVDVGGLLKRVQVKSSIGPRVVQSREGVYQFSLRRSKAGNRPMHVTEADLFAFVALDTRQIAYLAVVDLVGREGNHVVQCLQLRSATHGEHNGRSQGDKRAMRHFEDFSRPPW